MESVKVGILGAKDSWHSQRIIISLQRHGITPFFTSAEALQVHLGQEMRVLSGEWILSDTDLVIVRNIPGGSLEQIIYRMDVLHQLEDSGVRIVNRPGAIEKMVDKYYTSFLLQKAGLPVPDTILTESYEEALQAFHWLGQDVVLKPLFGSRGIGMVRLTDPEIAYRTFNALQLGNYMYYLQRFIPHDNMDIRTFVVGRDCIAAMKRCSKTWKTNIAKGGKPVAYQPSREIIDLSLAAAEALGTDFCGVDILPENDGKNYLIEMNSMPSWEGLQSVSTLDITDRIIDYVLSLIAGR